MEFSSFEIKASLNILKPAAEVFEAIVDPAKMSGYFISKGTGRMVTGAEITWSFPEMDMSFPIKVQAVEQDKLVSFYWGDEQQGITLSEIKLRNRGDETFVTVTEKQKPADEAGLKWLKGNTEGWANFLCCLKAYLEYGINLRKGAFLAEQMPDA